MGEVTKPVKGPFKGQRVHSGCIEVICTLVSYVQFPGVNSQFECPVCFEEMKPPVKMFHCRQGHVVCQNCLVEGHLKECPSCRGPIIGRNFAMEKLAESYFSNFDVTVK